MRIFNINGREEQTADIDKLVIYGGGKIHYQIEESCFTESEYRTDSKGNTTINSVYDGKVNAIILEKEIKRANKENLNRTDNYTLSYTPEYCRWEKRKALYIHESEINTEDLGDLLASVTEEEKCYLHGVRLTFKNAVTFKRMRHEVFEAADDWKIPDNGRWGDGYGTEERPVYDLFDPKPFVLSRKPELRNRYDSAKKYVIKRYYRLEKVENCSFIATERYYTKIEYSAERIRKDNIAKALNDSGLFHNQTFSHYDIDKLEKVLNISLK